jgi:hypothetical protein
MFLTTLWLLIKIAYRKILQSDLSDSFFANFKSRHTTSQSQVTPTPPIRPPRARDNCLMSFDNLEMYNFNRETTSDLSSLERVLNSGGMRVTGAKFSHSTPTSLNYESVLEPSNV